MIVIIEEAVFSSPPRASQLVEILHLGFNGRHRVQVDPLYDPEADRPVNRWLERQEPQLREEATLALEAGLEEAAHGVPSDHSVRIADVGSPDWTAEPPRLSLATAYTLLRRPLCLLLENHRHDRAFLETVALEPWRSRLKEALVERHMEPFHGGGLAEMKRTLEELDPTAGNQLIHWVLFDSDALEPGEPSPASEALRTTCEQHSYRHHQLQRRAIENYLPPQALQAWVHSASRKDRRRRQQKADAFASMEPRQRHHYNMKRGFKGDESRGTPALFGDLPQRPELQEGFGDKIARLYHEPHFREEWFVRDGQKEETTRMVQGIFRAL